MWKFKDSVDFQNLFQNSVFVVYTRFLPKLYQGFLDTSDNYSYDADLNETEKRN